MSALKTETVITTQNGLKTNTKKTPPLKISPCCHHPPTFPILSSLHFSSSTCSPHPGKRRIRRLTFSFDETYMYSYSSLGGCLFKAGLLSAQHLEGD